MDKKERRQITYRIGDLIEKKCRGCEFNGKNRTAQECVPCPTGKELKRLGNLLEKKKKVEEPKGEKEVKKIREISKEEIETLKEQGKSDPEVQEILGISHVKLNELKQKYDLIGKYPRVFKPRKEKPEKQLRELNNEMIEEIEDLKKEVEFLRKTNVELIKQRNNLSVKVNQLEGLVNELADEKDNMTAACEDLEDEVARLKEHLGQKGNSNMEEQNTLLRKLLKEVL